MVKIQEQNGQFFVTLPKEIVKFKNWKKGQNLLITQDRSGVVMIVEER